MQWRKLRDVEWVASLIDMVWGLCKRAWKEIASVGGVSMSWLMGWIPDWLVVLLAAFVGVATFSLIESFVKKKIRERNKEENQQKKSNLESLRKKLDLAMLEVESAQDQRDEYKRQVEDKEKKLSDCWGANEVLREDYGKAILWVQGRDWKSRELSVAVQHVRIEDAELAKQIRGLLAVHLQDDSYSKENHTVEHILLPFENPSSTARVVLFSDSEVGIDIRIAFDRYKLISEKMDRFEKSFAGGKVPEVDIAIVVFPPDRSADLTTRAMTQAEYDVSTKDKKTVYLITNGEND